MKVFKEEVSDRINNNGQNEGLIEAAHAFTKASTRPKYSYNFSWLGRPIFQDPQDIIALQELICSIQPNLIVETGIAHGGSLVFSASMVELNAACGGPRDATSGPGCYRLSAAPFTGDTRELGLSPT